MRPVPSACSACMAEVTSGKHTKPEFKLEEDSAHDAHEEALKVVEDADKRQTEGRGLLRL